MYLKVVDYLRGYSISTIVIYHLCQLLKLPYLLDKAVNFGSAGVHTFILCSGFGLFLSFLNRPIGFVDFIKKRFLKVYVPYAALVLITFLVPFVDPRPDRFQALLSHLLLYKMFDNDLMESFGGHLWFISMIFQFYFVFPLLAYMVQKSKPQVTLPVSLIISLGWSVLTGLSGHVEDRNWSGFFLQFLWEFVWGMEAARYFFTNKRLRIPSKNLLLLIALVFIPITGYLGFRGGVLKTYNDIPSAIGYLAIALLIYSLGWKWFNNLLIRINTFSYEWYLIHILVFLTFFHFTEGNAVNKYVVALLALGVSIFAALGFKAILDKQYRKAVKLVPGQPAGS